MSILLAGALMVLGLAALVATAAEQKPLRHPLDELIGSTCVVQFRRDALGAGADLPVPPTTDSVNGAQVSLGGKLWAARPDGILIERSGETMWIPMHAVLSVSGRRTAPQ